MKYVLLFGNQSDHSGAPVPADAQAAIDSEVMSWWGQHAGAGTIIGGERLAAGATATTFKVTGSDVRTIDGPFIEGKEEIGGFGIIEVPDLDSALALARTWPLLKIEGQSVEVRPVLDM